MDKDRDKLREEMSTALIKWYDFQPKTNVLIIDSFEIDASFLEERNVTVFRIKVEQLFDETFIEKYIRFFEYVIGINFLEKTEPITTLVRCRKLLQENGKLLLGVDNRLGIRYLCGERDPFTNKSFAGIENYISVAQEDIEGRNYSQDEWKEIFREAGINECKFYSVFPSLEYVQLIFAEGSFPNEELLGRYFPRYKNPETVFINEEKVISGISNSDLFHTLANSYLVEYSKMKDFSKVNHVTLSTSRGPQYACMTIIKENGVVEKKPISIKGMENIYELSRNMEELKKQGVSVVEGKLRNDGYEMPYISGVMGNVYLQRLLMNDKNLFIKQMDSFRKIILKSSRHTSENEYGIILEKGFIDLVPLNSFWVNEEFKFFDQEFSISNLPANVILYRTIIIVYNQIQEERQSVSMEFMLKRYGLEQHIDIWQKNEIDFLDQIRSDKDLNEFNNQTMRNEQMAEYIKNTISSADFYEEYLENCFNDLKNMKVFIFGAGKYADKFLALYKNDYNICKVLDNDQNKWGGEIQGITINSPESIVGEQEAYKIIICAKNYKPIFSQLKNMQVVNIGIYDANYVYPGRQNVKTNMNEKKRYHIGYLSGVFDLFHIGHLNIIKRAKEKCDYLIVGVTSDEYVRLQKQREPFVPFVERIEMVRSCKYVDEAVAVPYTYGGTIEAFQKYHFDCQFCGSDYVNDNWWLEQKEYLEGQGSELEFLSYTEETNSTKIKALIEKRLV